MIFRTKGKAYHGSSALEVVRAIESDTDGYPHRGQPTRRFLAWSLARLTHVIPPREMDLSERLEDEAAALNYLCLRDEYGAGKLVLGERASN
jgi:hypothetical protein